MAQAGNSFRIVLGETHLGWGNHRYTNSRDIIYGEGYIPIPAKFARKYNIFNSNNFNTGLGYNLFNAASSDGIFQGLLKSSGCSKKGYRYAKNLHGCGNLKALGYWFSKINAVPGDLIEVRWTSPTDIILTRI